MLQVSHTSLWPRASFSSGRILSFIPDSGGWGSKVKKHRGRGLQFWSHSRISPAGRCLVSRQLRPYDEAKDATVFISHALESLTPGSSCFRKPKTGCQLHGRLLGPVFRV